MDDRARIARFGGARRDVAMGDRVLRFVDALAGRLRRELGEGAAVGVDHSGSPPTRVELRVDAGPAGAGLRAAVAYEDGRFSGSVTLAADGETTPHLMELLRSILEAHAGVADELVPAKEGLAFGPLPDPDGTGELPFLFVRDLCRAIPALARAAAPGAGR